MGQTRIKLLNKAALALLSLLFMSHAVAEEKIIQQEKISYEKCLKIITSSAKKLTLAPVIKDLTDQKRIAVFSLTDGTLKITCDGLEGNVIVSTKTN